MAQKAQRQILVAPRECLCSGVKKGACVILDILVITITDPMRVKSAASYPKVHNGHAELTVVGNTHVHAVFRLHLNNTSAVAAVLVKRREQEIVDHPEVWQLFPSTGDDDGHITGHVTKLDHQDERGKMARCKVATLHHC